MDIIVSKWLVCANEQIVGANCDTERANGAFARIGWVDIQFKFYKSNLGKHACLSNLCGISNCYLFGCLIKLN